MKKSKGLKLFMWLVFILYIGVLVYFMFFAEMLGRNTVVSEYRYNLTPFKEIKRFLVYYNQLGLKKVAANLAGNVIAFAPFGIALPLLSDYKLKFLTVTLYSFALSLIIELTQLVSKVGSFDVDDLVLNTLGGMIGYLMFFVYKKIFKKE